MKSTLQYGHQRAIKANKKIITNKKNEIKWKENIEKISEKQLKWRSFTQVTTIRIKNRMHSGFHLFIV